MNSLCSAAKMSRQNYYKIRKTRKKQLVESDKILEYVRSERAVQPRLGCRKLLHIIGPKLKNECISIGRERFFNLMRQNNLLIKRKRNYCRTTDSRHSFKVYGNTLKDTEITAANQALAADITYMKTANGFVYLALVMDLYSRAIVGWDCSGNLESVGAQRALKKALRQLPTGASVIHHSDRGSQYCCREYIKLLKRHRISMTEENHCYENATAERLNGILKQEFGLGGTFRCKRDASKAVREAVELYNNRRPHLALDYKVPAEVHRLAQTEGNALRARLNNTTIQQTFSLSQARI